MAHLKQVKNCIALKTSPQSDPVKQTSESFRFPSYKSTPSLPSTDEVATEPHGLSPVETLVLNQGSPFTSASNEATLAQSYMPNVALGKHSVRSSIDTPSEIGSGPSVSTFAVARAAKKVAKKKYKPVALKVRPILGELPDKFRIIRNIPATPLQECRF